MRNLNDEPRLVIERCTERECGVGKMQDAEQGDTELGDAERVLSRRRSEEK